MNNQILVLVCVTALATACGGNTPDEAASREQTTGVGNSADNAAAPPEGSWHTEKITPRTVREFLTAEGLGKAAATVVKEQGYPTNYTLAIAKGRFQTTNSHGDVVDEGAYQLRGHTLTWNPDEAGGASVYTWSVHRDTLDLEFVKTTEADYLGLPAAAFNRAIYDLATYHRSR